MPKKVMYNYKTDKYPFKLSFTQNSDENSRMSLDEKI